jgi:L-fuconolactonase
MFGSDWPVCELAATYDQVHDAARAVTAELSTSDQEEVFAGTATRAYPISRLLRTTREERGPAPRERA